MKQAQPTLDFNDPARQKVAPDFPTYCRQCKRDFDGGEGWISAPVIFMPADVRERWGCCPSCLEWVRRREEEVRAECYKNLEGKVHAPK